MAVKVRVVSQRPPGGRCKLYADYADTLARLFGGEPETVYSETRDAHGEGFPSLWLNGVALQPEDGLILMPSDIAAALAGVAIPGDRAQDLEEALHAPLERMLEQAQGQGHK